MSLSASTSPTKRRDPDEWRGTPAQRRALACSAFELLYGGAAGGGKSDYLLIAPLRWVHLPRFRALLLRRSFPELERTLLARARDLYPRLGARYHEQRHEWTFPSGARISFGYLERPADALRYQGAEFAFVGFDELTHFDEASYRYLTSRVRSADGLPLRVRATTNPGGPGHEWVRARWAPWIGPAGVRGAAPGSVRWYDHEGAQVPEGTPDALSRTFVPAKLSDNPYLGAEYRAQLLALDPVTRAQLLDGDWDATVGEGKLFHRDWWVVLDAAPADVTARCRAWDLGATADGDPTRGVLLGDRGAGATPRWVVLDVATVRGPPHEVEALIVATAARDGRAVTVCLPQDPGQAGLAQVQHLTRKLSGYRVEHRRPSAAKVTRWGPVSSQVGARNVALVRAPWTAGLIAEGHAAPDGPHDDQLDALADAFDVLADGYVPDGDLADAVSDLAGIGRRPGGSLIRSDDDDDL
ncbi:MAG TPA: phage terminase large subunit [Gemmatimonadaceae bacterium]|nr:phage terminase large subunit [Gemmatimonadaceae bacterium]